MTIALWVASWFLFMGPPNYLFGRGRLTYFGNPVSNSAWYLLGGGWLGGLFYQELLQWFENFYVLHSSAFAAVVGVWLLIWLLYPVDQYTLKERLRYQVTKIFDILFQQLFFLTGVLLFPDPWYLFGVIFFLMHLPVPFIIPKQFGLLTMFFSLPGGILFAYLYSKGVEGALVSVALHFLFYAVLPFVFGTKLAPNMKLIRR